MSTTPDPIWHQNPPTTVPDRVIPPKPGTFDPKLPKETPAKPKKPKKKPSK